MSYSSATLWTGAHQAPLSMEFSRQEHWSAEGPAVVGPEQAGFGGLPVPIHRWLSVAAGSVSGRESRQQVHNRRTWLKKLTTAKCLCFVLLAADFMETLVRTACIQCNKEHLQMAVQNSDGRISPPVPSVTRLSESLPAQSTDGSVPEAQAELDSTSLSM